MRSGNPVLGDNTFEIVDRGEAKMTLTGTVNKTAILLALTLISALWVWNKYFELQDPASVLPLMWIGIIGGLVMAFLNNGLALLGFGADVVAMIKGLVLLVAVGIDVWNKQQGRPSITGWLTRRFAARREPEPFPTSATDSARGK